MDGTLKSVNDVMRGSLIPIDELSSPIGLRVEGGGYIFYDDTVGFRGGIATPSNKNGSNISPNALANRWSISLTTNPYHEYAYDFARGYVVRTSLSTCNRFMVVDETDLVSVAFNSNLKWDTGSTSRSTNTAFGYGSANTTTLCSAITDTSCIWYTVKNNRRLVIPNSPSSTSDSATDTRWFIPSRDELCVLNFMQYYDTTYRPTTGICSKRLQIPFRRWYWSSSQYASYSSNAWLGVFNVGDMGINNENTTYYARLCRTF